VLARRFVLLAALAVAVLSQGAPAAEAASDSPDALLRYRCSALRAAVEDLIATYGPRYPKGREYLDRLDRLGGGSDSIQERLEQLKREALLSNPLLDFDKVLLVKRKDTSGDTTDAGLGLPSSDECNSSLPREGYDNEIAVLSLAQPWMKLATLYRPDGGYVGEMDLHWDADWLLFSQSDKTHWKLWEIRVDGTHVRQVSQMPDAVDSFDACYLPNGQIVFGSTASCQGVPWRNGETRVANLYVMNADGSGVRQLCFDQNHDLHPCVLGDGQVLYHRWDSAGINHLFRRLLMAMNPDGTGQHAVYGSNSRLANSLCFPQPLPGCNDKFVCILADSRGTSRMGQLALVDASRGWSGTSGLVRRISGRGDSIEEKIAGDPVTEDWPKFLHPYPLSARHFLVACRPDAKSNWGIYLADAFDNLVLIREEPGYALLEPVPIAKRARPPVPVDRVDLERKDGIVYLHSVYTGPGLAGVPRGTIQRLRVIAYDFGYPGLAGPDRIGFHGPTDVMRILGSVPLEEDGSVTFRVPANTPVAVQALDKEGKAVQLMRSGFTVMPGETLSCVGCHERPVDVTPSVLAMAMRLEPRDIEPWRGPARGFGFAREVQPVLNRHCATCHDGQAAQPDLRSRAQIADRPKDSDAASAYRAVIPYVCRVGVDDDPGLLTPGVHHADTSPLIQLLRKGHEDVRLDAEAWDRLVTWIDLNAPCHGTWGEVSPIPDGVHARRMELRKTCGGPADDPEAIPERP